jgi:5-methylcytosine-specific restriction endonuclease McrA
MKRSPMPGRKKPMSPGSSVLRRGALVRQSAMTRTAATPKPPKREPAEVKARKVVRARSSGLCELDGRTPATEMHHRKNRSQGGAWAPSNLLHLCSAHHLHVTTHPQASREQGWAVPSHREPSGVPVWLARLGWAFLDDQGNYETEEAA